MTHARIRPATSTSSALVRRVAPLALAAFVLPGLAMPTPAAAAMTVAERRESVLDHTNAARAAAGCGPLVMSKRLKSSAQAHANDMARNDYFAHTSPNGTTWPDRIRAVGYSKPGAENIALGLKTPKAVVRAWMNSPAHRQNILTCNLKKLGVGYSKDGRIWVQDFGR